MDSSKICIVMLFNKFTLWNMYSYIVEYIYVMEYMVKVLSYMASK